MVVLAVVAVGNLQGVQGAPLPSSPSSPESTLVVEGSADTLVKRCVFLKQVLLGWEADKSIVVNLWTRDRASLEFPHLLLLPLRHLLLPPRQRQRQRRQSRKSIAGDASPDVILDRSLHCFTFLLPLAGSPTNQTTQRTSGGS